MITKGKKSEEKSEKLPVDPDEGKVEIDLDDVEAADDEREEDKSEAREPTESNSRRRGRNYREMEDRLSAAERRAEEAATRASQLEGHVRDLSMRAVPRDTKPDEDPTDRELDNLHEEQRLIVTRLEVDKNISRDDLNDLEKRARKLDLRKQELVAERVMKKHMPQQQAQRDPVRAQLEAEYGDVYENANAQAYAHSWASMEVAAGRRQAGLQLARDALDQARRQFKMRSASPEPSDGVRARMSGVPSRTGAGAAPAKRMVTMSRQHQRMAEAMYPKMSEKAAYEKWAKGPGKRIMEGSNG